MKKLVTLSLFVLVLFAVPVFAGESHSITSAVSVGLNPSPVPDHHHRRHHRRWRHRRHDRH